MLLLFLVYIALCLYKAKPCFYGIADYMQIENTQAIKGIFIIMIFFSHFSSYITLSESLPNAVFSKILTIIGQGMVTLFMFYSGYGVMESIKKKGTPYVKNLPKNRILATLFKFDLAVLLFLVLSLVLGEEITLKRVLLSLIGWDALGNSNWYIFVILVLYVLTYIVFSLLKNKPYTVSVFVLSVLICALVFITWRFNIKQSYWYDTMLCYVFGMVFSFIKPTWEKLFGKNIVIWGFAIIAALLAFYVLKWDHPLLDTVANVLFTAAVVLFTMHITLKNKVLVWCGENLFELYILQRITMIILSRLGVNNISVILSFVLCAVITVLLAIVFKKYSNKLWRAIAVKK